MIDLLEDENEKARYNAMSILARFAKEFPEDVEPTVDELIDVLDDYFPFTRGKACWAIGYTQASEALPELETLIDDNPQEEIRAGARFAVKQIRADF